MSCMEAASFDPVAFQIVWETEGYMFLAPAHTGEPTLTNRKPTNCVEGPHLIKCGGGGGIVTFVISSFAEKGTRIHTGYF